MSYCNQQQWDYIVPEGYHLHKCDGCSCIWEHSDKMGGDQKAHTCPKCGAEQWRKYFGDNIWCPTDTVKVTSQPIKHSSLISKIMKYLFVVATLFLLCNCTIVRVGKQYDFCTGKVIVDKKKQGRVYVYTPDNRAKGSGRPVVGVKRKEFKQTVKRCR